MVCCRQSVGFRSERPRWPDAVPCFASWYSCDAADRFAGPRYYAAFSVIFAIDLSECRLSAGICSASSFLALLGAEDRSIHALSTCWASASPTQSADLWILCYLDLHETGSTTSSFHYSSTDSAYSISRLFGLLDCARNWQDPYSCSHYQASAFRPHCSGLIAASGCCYLLSFDTTDLGWRVPFICDPASYYCPSDRCRCLLCRAFRLSFGMWVSALMTNSDQPQLSLADRFRSRGFCLVLCFATSWRGLCSWRLLSSSYGPACLSTAAALLSSAGCTLAP